MLNKLVAIRSEKKAHKHCQAHCSNSKVWHRLHLVYSKQHSHTHTHTHSHTLTDTHTAFAFALSFIIRIVASTCNISYTLCCLLCVCVVCVWICVFTFMFFTLCFTLLFNCSSKQNKNIANNQQYNHTNCALNDSEFCVCYCSISCCCYSWYALYCTTRRRHCLLCIVCA